MPKATDLEFAQRAAFGARVKELRKVNDLTQEQLSEATDLHRTYIGSIESGRRNVSLDNIYRLAAAFKVEARELL